MEPITLAAIAVFLAPYLQKAGEKVAEKTIESLFDSRKDLADKFYGLFKSEIISLNLTDSVPVQEINKRIEAKPEIKERVGQKVAGNQHLLSELVEAAKQLPTEEFRGININAKNVGAVINDPSAPITITNTFS